MSRVAHSVVIDDTPSSELLSTSGFMPTYLLRPRSRRRLSPCLLELATIAHAPCVSQKLSSRNRIVCARVATGLRKGKPILTLGTWLYPTVPRAKADCEIDITCHSIARALRSDQAHSIFMQENCFVAIPRKVVYRAAKVPL